MRTFILSIFLLALGVVAVLSMSISEMEKLGEACMFENKVHGNLLFDAYYGSRQEKNVPMNLKCALKCYFEKVGVFDSVTFEFMPEKAKEIFPTDADAIDKCKHLKDDNPCEAAYKIIKCYWDR